MLTLRSLLVILLLLPLPAAATSLEGRARVIDGDTIEIEGARVRLFGIDAPETAQTCEAAGTDWPCGRWATETLRARLRDRPVRCEGDERDRYGRLLANCSVEGEDLGAWLVRSGAAFAYRRYSSRYVEDEAHASMARAGVWSGRSERPEEFRHSGGSVAPGNCTIKGNVSQRGRIYHLPGQEDYARTVISRPEERWFCSVAEAESAGFRPARR
ncbi:thermonuclease family protein [Cereibacter sphaeroides]|uniref:thermonuclease family protein n=1 Tax=Cereibacter sphaeroides TaxID=1063 RepID=UPI001F23E50D|nr:thermonuclease family protein [Cereibacter sphaeroides]MCE6951959.1 thermonuclease family protein [Cereibacter sphaeroides]